MKGRRKWWLIPIILLVAAGVGVFAFWDTLDIYLAPKTVLSKAIMQSYGQLEQRFAGNPLLMAMSHLDPEGNQTITLTADTSQPLVGNIRYDMTLQTGQGRLFAQGQALTAQKDLDLEIYADTEFMAVSSEDLVGGRFYGITYDSFREDIQSIPLLSWFISDALMEDWNGKVLDVRQKMTRQWTIPQLPKLTAGDMEALATAVLAMPADRDWESLEINGQRQECRKLSFSYEGQAISEFLRGIVTIPEGESPSIELDCWLWEKKLVLAEAELEAGDREWKMALRLGTDPVGGPLTICWEIPDHNKNTLQIVTEIQGNQLHEIWYLEQENRQPISCAYDWNADTGAMGLSLNNAAPVQLNLQETDNGLRIRTEDWHGLWALLSDERPEGDKAPVDCDMTIRAGSDFAVPAFVNLDQWSVEDFLLLLEGLSGLLGLTLA